MWSWQTWAVITTRTARTSFVLSALAEYENLFLLNSSQNRSLQSKWFLMVSMESNKPRRSVPQDAEASRESDTVSATLLPKNNCPVQPQRTSYRPSLSSGYNSHSPNQPPRNPHCLIHKRMNMSCQSPRYDRCSLRYEVFVQTWKQKTVRNRYRSPRV